MPHRTLDVLLVTWRIGVAIIGLGHAAIGALMLYDGDDWLIGPVFSQAAPA